MSEVPGYSTGCSDEEKVLLQDVLHPSPASTSYSTHGFLTVSSASEPPANWLTNREEFEEYAEKAKTLPDTTTNESKLCLYSLYKEATVGPVNTGIFTFYAPFLSFPYY
ncbi:Acyl-CoA-binding protein [Hordeum vulgare]|nr:Acyl-CoA-binding protein [Hordeum vulgare]